MSVRTEKTPSAHSLSRPPRMSSGPYGSASRILGGRTRKPSRITPRAFSSRRFRNWPEYWASDYDVHRCEAKLNGLPQFKTEIDGLDIHFIHVRSGHENALPLILTHGWPARSSSC